jgi:hypothetical protein
MQTPETLRQKESFPILEDSYITSRIWESVELLRREMGPCDMGNRDSVHISKYLKRFAPIITQNCLSANAVYNLLTFVMPGQTQSFVYSKRDSELPFLKLWGFTSVFCLETTFLETDPQEMEKLFEGGLKHVTSVFKRIAALWELTSNGESELQKCIVDESTLYDMRRYIHTHFASQASAIEIYYCIQSKVQKEEEKARLQAGLKPEIGLPDYMY